MGRCFLKDQPSGTAYADEAGREIIAYNTRYLQARTWSLSPVYLQLLLWPYQVHFQVQA
jgi:hypothetical protein